MSVSAQVKRAYLKVVSDSTIRKEIGKRIVDRIVERTQDQGIDKDGNKFTKYSKAYMKSLEFRVYGKSKKVDLTLTGAMLSSVDVISTGDVVKVGFTDKEQFLKASGHIDGTGANNALPVRDFWGLPLEDVQTIIKETIKDANSDYTEALASLDKNG